LAIRPSYITTPFVGGLAFLSTVIRSVAVPAYCHESSVKERIAKLRDEIAQLAKRTVCTFKAEGNYSERRGS
jgi:hypothetical protein